MFISNPLRSLESVDDFLSLDGPILGLGKDFLELDLTVEHLPKLLMWVNFHSRFPRRQSGPQDVNPTINKGNKATKTEYVRTVQFPSAGTDTYTCECAGKASRAREVVRRVRGSKKRGCGARLNCNFEEGYQHLDGEINVGMYGHKRVRVIWYWAHNHDVRSLENVWNAKLSAGMWKYRQELVKARVDWVPIEDKISETGVHFDPSKSSDFLRVKFHHVYNLRRHILRLESVKHADLSRSLTEWAKHINAEGGFGQFRDDLATTADGLKKKYVWSICIMSAWQRKVLDRDGRVFLLDSTDGECTGIHGNENVFLYTIVVKNSLTGDGVPVAHMLTNSQKSHVIADFLQKIRSNSDFDPRRAVVDCDIAERNAIKEVFGSIKTMACYWHVARAFSTKLKSKQPIDDTITVPVELQEHIQNELARVSSCKTKDEALEIFQKFFDDFTEQPSVIAYIHKQWRKLVDHLCGGSDIPWATTYNYIESWHKTLNKRFVCGRYQRVDTSVNLLFATVATAYMADEILVSSGKKERSLDEVEASNKANADALSDEQTFEHVSQKEHFHYVVKSSTAPGTEYEVKFSQNYQARREGCCTCSFYILNRSWCKHIFLALRWGNLKGGCVASRDNHNAISEDIQRTNDDVEEESSSINPSLNEIHPVPAFPNPMGSSVINSQAANFGSQQHVYPTSFPTSVDGGRFASIPGMPISNPPVSVNYNVLNHTCIGPPHFPQSMNAGAGFPNNYQPVPPPQPMIGRAGFPNFHQPNYPPQPMIGAFPSNNSQLAGQCCPPIPSNPYPTMNDFTIIQNLESSPNTYMPGSSIPLNHGPAGSSNYQSDPLSQLLALGITSDNVIGFKTRRLKPQVLGAAVSKQSRVEMSQDLIKETDQELKKKMMRLIKEMSEFAETLDVDLQCFVESLEGLMTRLKMGKCS